MLVIHMSPTLDLWGNAPQKLKDIGRDWKLYVMNNKANGGMATDFKKAVSYPKNCVATTQDHPY